MIDQEINEAVARGLGLSPYRSSEGYLVYRSHPKIEKRVPNYCHDTKAAWEIVASLQPSHGFSLLWLGNMWQANFADLKFEKPTHGAELAPEAAMVICLAFLKLQEGVKR